MTNNTKETILSNLLEILRTNPNTYAAYVAQTTIDVILKEEN